MHETGYETLDFCTSLFVLQIIPDHIPPQPPPTDKPISDIAVVEASNQIGILRTAPAVLWFHELSEFFHKYLCF